MEALVKKQTNRISFLNRLYERTNGDPLELEDMWVIGDEIGLSHEETQRGTNAEHHCRASSSNPSLHRTCLPQAGELKRCREQTIETGSC